MKKLLGAAIAAGVLSASSQAAAKTIVIDVGHNTQFKSGVEYLDKDTKYRISIQVKGQAILDADWLDFQLTYVDKIGRIQDGQFYRDYFVEENVACPSSICAGDYHAGGKRFVGYFTTRSDEGTYQPPYDLGQDSGAFAYDVMTYFSWSAYNYGYDIHQATITIVPASAVPEPATWAMMITGFSMAGTMLRRRPRLQAA